MKKVISLLIGIFLCLTLNGQWYHQSSPINETIIDIQFITKLNGWAISNKSVIKTDDGGVNWVVQELPGNIPNMKRLQFVNSLTGYIVGDRGLLIKTNDGGTTWQIMQIGFSYNISDLYFFDDSSGWLTGWEETNLRTGVILHTNDGGSNWELQLLKSSSNLFGSTIFMAIKFYDKNVGWALGGDYVDNFSATYIYHTEDGGRNWNVLSIWENWTLYEFEIVSKDTLWASGFPMVISFDGGVNWNCFGFENPDFLINANSLSPVSGLRGWAVHINSLIGQYGIYYTDDGGLNWKESLHLEDSYALCITRVIEGNIWAAGTNGLIVTRDNINSTENNFKIVDDFLVYQNYPNPFNSQTVIRYLLAQSTYVKLKIYDSLGSLVNVLVNAFQLPGIHEQKLNTENLSSGIYYYTLETSNSFETKKIVHIK